MIKDTEMPLEHLLADLCDILFDDDERAEIHGYHGVIERAREVMECAKIPDDEHREAQARSELLKRLFPALRDIK